MDQTVKTVREVSDDGSRSPLENGGRLRGQAEVGLFEEAVRRMGAWVVIDAPMEQAGMIGLEIR
jgi:hypothetical protein